MADLMPEAAPWWFAAAAVMGVAGLAAPALRRDGRGPLLVFVALALTFAGWTAWRSGGPVEPFDLDEPAQLWQVRGRVASMPRLLKRPRGAMAEFGFLGPATMFEFETVEAVDRFGVGHPMRARLWVRVAGADVPVGVGDLVRLTGMVRDFEPAMNPGQFDRAVAAQRQGLAGAMSIASAEAVEVEGGPETFWQRFRRAQEGLRRRASERIGAEAGSGGVRALLLALLLGERGSALDEVERSFRRTGLSHVLAISGLHLGILVWLVAGMCRAIGMRPGMRTVLVALLIGWYLVVVPVQTPLLRAALMFLAVLAAGSTGRRVSVAAMLALAGIVTLTIDPFELFNAGFQFSYGIVAALLGLSEPMRRLLFGARIDEENATTAQIVWNRLTLTVAATTVAWLVSVPIAIAHFGAVSLAGIPATILSMPLVTLVLGLGFISLLASTVTAGAGAILDGPVEASATALLKLVEALEGANWMWLTSAAPPSLWATVAIAVIATWLLVTRRQTAWGAAAAITLAFPWWWPVVRAPMADGPVATITMLAVGDGSCYIVQSGGETILFDAGSGDWPSMGWAVALPALREAGVRRIDCLIVSHEDLDHFNASLDIADVIPIGEVVTTASTIATARERPGSAVGVWLAGMEARGAAISAVGAGWERALGPARLRCLQPTPEQEAALEADNDRSLVVRLEAAGTAALLTGDIEEAGIEALLGLGREALSARVLELPHHGSWSEAAVALVAAVRPDVVLQSTGRRRAIADRWGPGDLGAAQRVVSARDGAARVTIDRRGHVRLERWRQGWSQRPSF